MAINNQRKYEINGTRIQEVISYIVNVLERIISMTCWSHGLLITLPGYKTPRRESKYNYKHWIMTLQAQNSPETESFSLWFVLLAFLLEWPSCFSLKVSSKCPWELRHPPTAAGQICFLQNLKRSIAAIVVAQLQGDEGWLLRVAEERNVTFSTSLLQPAPKWLFWGEILPFQG